MQIVALSEESVRGDAVATAASQQCPASGLLPPSAQARRLCYDRSWRDALRLAIRDPAQLIAALELPAALIEPAHVAARSFPLFAPWPYVQRMAKGNPADPLLRQVLPLNDELTEEVQFTADPVGDNNAILEPGLL